MSTRAATSPTHFDAAASASAEPGGSNLAGRTLLKLAELVGRLLPAVVLTMLVVIGSLAYRFYAQAIAALPSSPPGTWLYDFAGRLTTPFERYETAAPIREAPAFNLPVLIALDVYLFAGCALLFLTWLARSMVAMQSSPFAVLRTRAAATRRIGPAVARSWRRADAALRVVAIRAIEVSRPIAIHAWTSFCNLDWAGYRLHAETALAQATSYVLRGVENARADYRRGREEATVAGRSSLAALNKVDATALASTIAEAQPMATPRKAGWLTERVLESAAQGRHRIGNWSAARRGPDLLTQAWERAAVAAGGLSRSQLARSPHNAAWLSQRAVSSALAGHRRLSAYRAQRARRSPFATSSHGHRMSRRSFLRLPASRV